MRYAGEHGFFELNPFPGCNQVVVSNHAFVYKAKRGLGFGQKQHEFRLDKAKKLGYSYIICTVNVTNAAEKHILVKNGWKRLDFFFNMETDNNIELWGKAL